jgi:hypothetical protein
MRDALFSEGGESALFCYKVPRLRPLVLLVGVCESEDVMVIGGGFRQAAEF